MKSLETLLAALLIVLLGAPAAWPTAARQPARAPYKSTQMQGDERIVHALNRFTFGPRPGDLDTVRAMGLEAWFDRQLHPETFDRHDLDARLAAYPATQWSTAQLLYYLPGNAVIRQAINGKAEIPQSGVMRAIYKDQIYRLQAKKDAKAANAPAVPAGNTQPGTVMAVASTQAPQFDPAETARILKLDPEQRVARLAAMQPEEFDTFAKSLRGPDRKALEANLTPQQKQTVGALENPEKLVADELIATRLTRDIYSPAQLQEVMTDFWLNHFNVYLHKNEQMPYYLVSYERDTVRPHALGKFEDLLESVAHSPAMLVYLDNAQSIGPDSVAAKRADAARARRPDAKKQAPEGLNENYARELMELHTVGVNGGYTQADVIQAARILTGWTIDRPIESAEYTFNPNRHEPGTKTVMGRKFKEDGEMEGRALLHMLATRPQTARFLAHELAVRFVSDNPPQPLVDRMAKAYLASGGDIAAVLKTMFHSPEFWTKTTYRAKVKTPLEFVVSAVRASDASIDNLMPLANELRQLGMPLYGAVPPTGYKWDAADWVSTGALVDRMNFALSLAGNRLPGIAVGWTQLPDLGDASAAAAETPTPATEEARLEALLIPGGVSASTREAALQQFAQQSKNGAPAMVQTAARPVRPRPAVVERQDELLAGLLIGSPEFQRR